MTAPSLDGRTFLDVTGNHAGDVGSDTVFDYHQEADGTVWARYAGGAVRTGFLVGTRRADALDFRYTHLTTSGETASGHCTSVVEQGPGGRLRLYETWRWESRPGSGTSVLEEALPV